MLQFQISASLEKGWPRKQGLFLDVIEFEWFEFFYFEIHFFKEMQQSTDYVLFADRFFSTRTPPWECWKFGGKIFDLAKFPDFLFGQDTIKY